MKRNKNVIFFARYFYPHIGGVEKHVKEVGKRLIKKGFRVTIVTENFDNLSENEMIEGISIIRINTGSEGRLKKFRIWFNLLKYYKVLKKADIVHCHDIFFWYLPFRFLFINKPVYTTFHGYEGNDIPGKKAIFMHKFAETLSKGNISIGGFFEKWYGTKPTIISFGAIDKKLLKECTNSNNKAVFLGRLENETGFMDYLKVVNVLKIPLDVYGEGSLLEEARKYTLKNNLRINFMGFKESADEEIGKYKILFTSRYLGILEGLAHKNVIFAQYNNEIKKDYLTISPFSDYIYICRNSNDIINKVKLFLKQPNSKMQELGFNWVKKQTWGKMVANYLRLWKIK